MRFVVLFLIGMLLGFLFHKDSPKIRPIFTLLLGMIVGMLLTSYYVTQDPDKIFRPNEWPVCSANAPHVSISTTPPEAELSIRSNGSLGLKVSPPARR